MRLRSTLNPEEQTNLVEGPTRFKKGPNQSELVCGVCHEIYYVDEVTFRQACGVCHEIYYVDEVTFRQAMLAMEEGIDNPFCCDECEGEYEELSH